MQSEDLRTWSVVEGQGSLVTVSVILGQGEYGECSLVTWSAVWGQGVQYDDRKCSLRI